MSSTALYNCNTLDKQQRNRVKEIIITSSQITACRCGWVATEDFDSECYGTDLIDRHVEIFLPSSSLLFLSYQTLECPRSIVSLHKRTTMMMCDEKLAADSLATTYWPRMPTSLFQTQVPNDDFMMMTIVKLTTANSAESGYMLY